jgi:hypothetical protein
MNPEDKQKPESERGSRVSEASRKRYSPPRLRSIGKMNIHTGSIQSRKKPQG